jgi:uncharacterized protein (TIGR01777 family)
MAGSTAAGRDRPIFHRCRLSPLTAAEAKVTAIRFEFASELPVSAEEAYNWHTRPGALERLCPPWEDVRVLEVRGGFEDRVVVMEIPLGPFHRRWVARHRDVAPGRRFTDEQVEGPFARWVHTHLFEPLDGARCRYIDRIEYELPLGQAGALAAGFVARRIGRGIRYRHATVREDLAAQFRVRSGKPLTIVVSGASGLIGRSLLPFLTTAGHRVRRLTRGNPGVDEIPWSPATGRLDPESLEGVDAVIHLAGEPIVGRWTRKRRRQILKSRSTSTSLLADTLARLQRPPRVLLSASAVGIYGDRGDEPLTEAVPIRGGPEASFVEQVGLAWEAATAPAARAGIRVALARLGIVLTPAGGALATMLPAFRAGVAGPLGNGRQFMSWIGIDDVVSALHLALFSDQLEGAVNLTAPQPVTNAEFTRALGQVLGRPAVARVPAGVLRLLLGEMADDLLLASCRAIPARLVQSGYVFRHTDVRAALRHVLGRWEQP